MVRVPNMDLLRSFITRCYMVSRKNIAVTWCVIFCCALSVPVQADPTGVGAVAVESASADSANNELLATLNSYYRWVLANGETVAKKAPGIVDVPATSKFYLDRSTEQEFINGFMDSGIFSTEFPAAVSKYYAKYEKEFSGYSDAEFDQMAHDGRGPLMEVEDMDIFFCAQEYTYKDEYIKNIRLKDLIIEGTRASVITIFPFEWETNFKLQKVDGKWLISAFCVYE